MVVGGREEKGEGEKEGERERGYHGLWNVYTLQLLICMIHAQRRGAASSPVSRSPLGLTLQRVSLLPAAVFAHWGSQLLENHTPTTTRLEEKERE